MKKLILLILLLFNIYAQAYNKLPFRYLNQYFNFQATGDNSFRINEKNYSFDDLNLIIEDGQLVINSEKINFIYGINPTAIDILDTNNKTVSRFSFRKNLVLNDEKYGENFQNISFICITTKNEFSYLKLCKNLKLALLNTVPDKIKFTVNGLATESSGNVILNDYKANLKFRSENNISYFELITGNKKVVPFKITKSENSDTMDVDFGEINKYDIYNFKKKIKLTDTSFSITTDDILSVRQDILLNDKNLYDKEISYLFKDIVTYTANKFGIEPYGIYALLISESSNFNARLVSNFSQGVKLFYSRYINNKIEYFFDFNYTILQLIQDSWANSIVNGTQNITGYGAGLRYYTNNNISYDGSIQYQGLLFAKKQDSGNTIELTNRQTPIVTANASKVFWSYDKFKFSSNAGISLIAPANLDTGNTSVAMGYSLSGQVSYKLNQGKFYYTLEYTGHNLKNSTYTYNYNSLKHGVGFFYLF